MQARRITSPTADEYKEDTCSGWAMIQAVSRRSQAGGTTTLTTRFRHFRFYQLTRHRLFEQKVDNDKDFVLWLCCVTVQCDAKI